MRWWVLRITPGRWVVVQSVRRMTPGRYHTQGVVTAFLTWAEAYAYADRKARGR